MIIIKETRVLKIFFSIEIQSGNYFKKQ